MTLAEDNGPERGGDDLLAAEYVLGVLPAEERQIASRRIDAETGFARLVDGWEVSPHGTAGVASQNSRTGFIPTLICIAHTASRQWSGTVEDRAEKAAREMRLDVDRCCPSCQACLRRAFSTRSAHAIPIETAFFCPLDDRAGKKYASRILFECCSPMC